MKWTIGFQHAEKLASRSVIPVFFSFRCTVKMAQCTPLFSCSIDPIEREFVHKYGIEVDNTILDYQHMVHACMFPCSKIFDSQGKILELRDLLHDSRVGYDW